MGNPFFEFFDRDRPPINPDSTAWPKEWKEASWKTYPRHRHFQLPKPSLPYAALSEVLQKRNSQRDFSMRALSNEEISAILLFSCGLNPPGTNPDRVRRPHPSGGALYPIEIYPIILQSVETTIPPSIYHYNILEHHLEQLSSTINKDEFGSAFYYPWVTEAAMVLIFSFVEARTKIKYGNFAYKVGLIEAGHIGQNVYLNCAALGVKCCAIGEFRAETIHRLIGLDGEGEVAFYAIAVGR